jgi:hypothetical protein
MQVFKLVDEHAMVALVGGANEDSDGEISRDALGSTAKHEYCATARHGGTAHGDGDSKPTNGAYRSTTKHIDQNPS